jgi:hypothetical protein
VLKNDGHYTFLQTLVKVVLMTAVCYLLALFSGDGDEMNFQVTVTLYRKLYHYPAM